MQFKPKSADDIKREGLIDTGVYDFEVTSAEDRKSKKGNDMIAIRISVYVDGNARPMRDWLMESMAYKLRHFCEVTGLLAKYEAGTLTAQDCQGMAGKVRIGIKDDEQYGPQNNVKDYVVAKAGLEPALTPPAKPSIPTGGGGNDEPPFARFSPESWG